MARNSICFHRYGTTFQSKRWLSVDACGFLGISLSISAHVFALIVIGSKLISESPVALGLYVLVYLPTALMALTSLYQAATTNPGAVPLGARPLTTFRKAADGSTEKVAQQRTMRRCHKCQDNFKPSRAHHDSVTDRCIVKFDHFCPWVNNAVGALNHKFFCLFVFYTAVSCLLSLLLLLLRLIHCGFVLDEDSVDTDIASLAGVTEAETLSEEQHDRILLDQHYVYKDCEGFVNNHFVIALALVSLIFLIFTCTMGWEQVEAIQTGQGKIARMKMRVGHRGTEFNRVTEEFNEMFGGSTAEVSWHWFSPFRPVQYPRGMGPVVLGYEWDPTFPNEPYYPPEQEGGNLSSGSRKDEGSDVEMQTLDHIKTGLKPSGASTTTTSDVLATSIHSNSGSRRRMGGNGRPSDSPNVV